MRIERITSLNDQGQVFSLEDVDLIWNSALLGLPSYTAKFAVNSILNTLPTGEKVKLWNAQKNSKMSGLCKICGQSQTLAHILAECSISGQKLNTDDPHNTVTWRHNEILNLVINSVKDHLPQNWKLIVDLKNHPLHYGDQIPSQYLKTSSTYRPDIILITNDQKTIIAELTSPMDTNMEYWNKEKTRKYENGLIPHLKSSAGMYAFKVGARGVIPRSFFNFLQLFHLSAKQRVKIAKEVSMMALECSRKIFMNRNTKGWTPVSSLSQA